MRRSQIIWQGKICLGLELGAGVICREKWNVESIINSVSWLGWLWVQVCLQSLHRRQLMASAFPLRRDRGEWGQCLYRTWLVFTAARPEPWLSLGAGWRSRAGPQAPKSSCSGSADSCFVAASCASESNCEQWVRTWEPRAFLGSGPNPASREVNWNFFLLKKGEQSELPSLALQGLGAPLCVMCNPRLPGCPGQGWAMGSQSPLWGVLLRLLELWCCSGVICTAVTVPRAWGDNLFL